MRPGGARQGTGYQSAPDALIASGYHDGAERMRTEIAEDELADVGRRAEWLFPRFTPGCLILYILASDDGVHDVPAGPDLNSGKPAQFAVPGVEPQCSR